MGRKFECLIKHENESNVEYEVRLQTKLAEISKFDSPNAADFSNSQLHCVLVYYNEGAINLPTLVKPITGFKTTK